MLRLEGEREPVDDGAEDLEEFSDAIEVLRLVDEPDCSRQQTANVKYVFAQDSKILFQGIFVLIASMTKKSSTHFKKKLLICFLMNALSPRNLP